MKTLLNKTRKISELDFNAIRDEILVNKRKLNSGKIDFHDFCGDLVKKYAKDKGYNKRTTADEDPTTMIVLYMMDLCGIDSPY